MMPAGDADDYKRVEMRPPQPLLHVPNDSNQDECMRQSIKLTSQRGEHSVLQCWTVKAWQRQGCIPVW